MALMPRPKLPSGWSKIRLDDGSLQAVVVELAVAGERAAVGKGTVVVHPGRAAAVAAVVRDEHLVAIAAALDRVGRHEDLVGVLRSGSDEEEVPCQLLVE